jgi:hypothetical protein
MDARKNDRRQGAKEEIMQSEVTAETASLSNEEMLMQMQRSTENTMNHLDKLIQSSSKRSNKRTYLELFRALIEENARYSESLIYLFEYVINLRASILLLSADLDKTRGRTTKDVRKLKSKLGSLLSSPAVVEIGKILQNMQRVSEEKKSQVDNDSVKEYLR